MHTRPTLRYEQDFVEHFKNHLEQTVNNALDLTFSPPVSIVVRDFILDTEGSPDNSQHIIKVLPHRMVAEILHKQYSWNFQMDATDTQISNEIGCNLRQYFAGRARVSKNDDQMIIVCMPQVALSELLVEVDGYPNPTRGQKLFYGLEHIKRTSSIHLEVPAVLLVKNLRYHSARQRLDNMLRIVRISFSVQDEVSDNDGHGRTESYIQRVVDLFHKVLFASYGSPSMNGRLWDVVARVSKDDGQMRIARMPQDLCFLVALSLRNVLSQHSILERLYNDGNNGIYLRAMVELLPFDVKVKQILLWIADYLKAAEFRKAIYENKFRTQEFKSLLTFAQNDTSPNGLNLIFALLPPPLERYKYFGGKGNFRAISIVPTGGITHYFKLSPDLAATVPEDASRNYLPADFKISKTWQPDWDSSSGSQRDAFWHAISQVQCYTYQHDVRYGYIICDTGLRCFRRMGTKGPSGISFHGHVELSPVINWGDHGQKLTVMLVLWYLHMLAAEDDCILPNLWISEKHSGGKTFDYGRKH
ncbi:hypothetical protein BU17DRAFT_65212 [Hysterangium stoloniferum]|nr:hypothetical protein BU17DRAFT_65212 [Hysterangium stoloniferum]